MTLPIPETFNLKYVPPTKDSIDDYEADFEVSDEMTEERSKENQTFMNTDKPALTQHENNNSKVESYTDQDLSIVATGQPQSAQHHLLKISDTESF